MYLGMAATYCSSSWGDKLLALDMIENIVGYDYFQYNSSYYSLLLEPKFINFFWWVFQYKLNHLTNCNF